MVAKVTPEKLSAFCTALAETCQVRKACKAVDIAIQTAYRWRKEMPDFAAEWDDAMKAGLLGLESEAHRRGFDGVDEPVFHQGEKCGTIRKYSDTLAIFLLKAHAPEKYRENTRMELTGAGGGPVQMTDTEAAAKLAGLIAAAKARKDEISDLV